MINLKKIFLNICIVIYFITVLLGVYINLKNGNYNELFMVGVAVFTPFLIPCLFYFCKFKLNDGILIINYIFVYFASLIGSGFNGYKIPFYDKLIHFSSGIIISMLIIIYWLINNNKIINRNENKLFLLFVFNTNLAIALLWEIFEYIMLILFNNDCINHYKTGVHDAMTDTLCALVAGIYIVYLLNNDLNNKKQSLLINFCKKVSNNNQVK